MHFCKIVSVPLIGAFALCTATALHADDRSMWQKFKDFFSPSPTVVGDGPEYDELRELDKKIGTLEGKYSRERRANNKKYIREEMLKRNIKASFALGGITAHMVKLHEEGLIGKLIDVQSFDKVAAESIARDPLHQEVSAVEYASGQHLGSATHALDIVILSALEVDVHFNVNVLVGSDGIIRGAIGGHQDTAADSALSIIVCPLLRGRIPCVVPKVTTLITPGKSVDVVVTEYGIAVNPLRPEIAERLKAAGLKLVDIEELARKATSIIGTPDSLPFGDRVVGVVMNRDGSVLDKIYNIR